MDDVNTDLGNMSISTSKNEFDKIRKANATKNSAKVKEYFEKFDKNRDGYLDSEEFGAFLNQVFSKDGQGYEMAPKQQADILKLLDEKQDGKIDLEEFTICWHHWLKQIVDPVNALVIVDVQNDFISGTMSIKDCPAGQDGEVVVGIINSFMKEATFDVVVYSKDWHPENHISFIENVKDRKLHHTTKVLADTARKMDTVIFEGPPVMEQKMWPGHCVQHSWGSDLHKELTIVENGVYINKGTNPEIDSYSAFWDNNKRSQTSLVHELSSRGITDVYVCGLAYDVCVGATAAHALEHGFRTILIEDASKGVDLDDIKKTREKLLRHGAAIVNSYEVAGMVAASDRRPDLGHQAALNVAMARKLIRQEAKLQRGAKDKKSSK